MISAIFGGRMDGTEVLRKIATYACWAMTVVATLGYAWARVRAYAAEGMPEAGGQAFGRNDRFTTAEGRALARRATLWAVVGVLFAIGAISLSA